MRKILSTILVTFFTLDAGYCSAAELSDKEIDNIVRRSYQYVAMFNTNNNFAMQKGNPFGTGGWNKMFVPETLSDHTFTAIPRPNNDSLYLFSMLDMRDDAVVIQFPAFDSKYVSLETSAYDHYIDVPLSTTKGDFKKPTTMLFYTSRTKNYKGEPIKGIDKTLNPGARSTGRPAASVTPRYQCAPVRGRSSGWFRHESPLQQDRSSR